MRMNDPDPATGAPRGPRIVEAAFTTSPLKTAGAVAMDTIPIHQAAFGYTDHSGHGVLAHSFPQTSYRSPRPIHEAEALSDLSGYMAFGEPYPEWYMTGYPLGEHYVFARTWLDREARRAGCCLTHALYVPIDRVAELPNYGMLYGLFQRPVRGSLESYRKAVDVPWPYPVPLDQIEQTTGGHPAGQVDIGEHGTVLAQALTRWAETRAPIVWTKPEQGEVVTRLFWNWLGSTERFRHLRRELAFGWACMQHRFLGKRPFDLVVIAPPARSYRAGFREAGSLYLPT
jgi:hypothetical protein